MPHRHRLLRIFAALALGLGIALAAAWPLRAAEIVVLEFGPFSRSIPTEALVTFAETGEVNAQLAPFLRRLNSIQRFGLRALLTQEQAVNVVPISQ
jgi:hypothetical protein